MEGRLPKTYDSFLEQRQENASDKKIQPELGSYFSALVSSETEKELIVRNVDCFLLPNT